jgi:hypothetical protein
MTHDQHGVTIPEAVRLLGISENAVRKRIRRRTLNTYRAGGRVYVLVGDQASGQADDPANRPSHDQAGDQVTDQRELIDQLKSENAFLRTEVEAWRTQAEQQRILLTGLEARMIEAPYNAPHSPQAHESAEQDPGHVYVESGPQRRPWWRFWR